MDLEKIKNICIKNDFLCICKNKEENRFRKICEKTGKKWTVHIVSKNIVEVVIVEKGKPNRVAVVARSLEFFVFALGQVLPKNHSEK